MAELQCFGGISRRPFWLDSRGEPAAAWLHHPQSGPVRPGGVVVCPSFGFEYAHSYRTLSHLADRLAGEGFVVVRMDYPGTGNSWGDESTPGSVGLWLRSVHAAADLVERLTGSGRASLVGLRLGATISGMVAAEREVPAWVGWAPVAGKRFVREISAIERIANGDQSGDYIEAGGFRMASETAEQVKSLDLVRSEHTPSPHVLIIDREDQSIGPRLGERLRSRGSSVSTWVQRDYLDMMAEPQYTIVPRETLARVVDWLDQTLPNTMADMDHGTIETLSPIRSLDGAGPGHQPSEELVLIPLDGPGDVPAAGSAERRALFGVLSQGDPVPDGVPSTLVLLPNAGSVHSVGPNRIYVELARALSRAGVASFRFDLRNLGDSRTGSPEDENHPYPESATADTTLAHRWLAEHYGYSSVTLAGLCSGAHTAFHGGLADATDPVDAVVCINPLTFRFHTGMSLDTPETYQSARDAQDYRLALRDFERWKKLLSGQSDLGYIARFLGKRMMGAIALPFVRFAGRFGLREATPLEKDLKAFDDMGRTIHFVLSSTDPGPEILRREAGGVMTSLTSRGVATVTTIEGADHTFSKKLHRARAITDIVRVTRGSSPV